MERAPLLDFQEVIAMQGMRLRRGVFSGVVDLQAAINRFLAEANECLISNPAG
ncbi:hypothetical protein ACFQU2_05760 [Siccirubricoccus deserti]